MGKHRLVDCPAVSGGAGRASQPAMLAALPQPGKILMARLTYAQRKALPKSDFAVPSTRNGGKGGYPIPDVSHARNALARVSEFGSPAEKAEVRAKVHREY